jgi:hypothetical protein
LAPRLEARGRWPYSRTQKIREACEQGTPGGQVGARRLPTGSLSTVFTSLLACAGSRVPRTELERGDVPVAAPLAEHLTSAGDSTSALCRRPPRWTIRVVARVWGFGCPQVRLSWSGWRDRSLPSIRLQRGGSTAQEPIRAHPTTNQPLQGEHLRRDLTAGWVCGSVHSVSETHRCYCAMGNCLVTRHTDH